MVKDKPLIHTIEENKDEPHYHNVSDEKLFEGSRIIDLLFVIKQLKDRYTVCGGLQTVAYLDTKTILKCVMARVSAFAPLICRKFLKLAKHHLDDPFYFKCSR